MSSTSYTVQVANDLLRSGHYEGTFGSYGAAETHAKEKAERSRSFASYQIYTGTPRRPGKPVGPVFRGTK